MWTFSHPLKNVYYVRSVVKFGRILRHFFNFSFLFADLDLGENLGGFFQGLQFQTLFVNTTPLVELVLKNPRAL